MRAYSVDLRERIVRAVEGGMTQHEAARVYGVGRATVERYLSRVRRGQVLEAAPNPGSPPRVLPPEQHDLLLAQLRAHPDLTNAEHALLWSEQHGKISTTTMARRVRTVGWTRKKDAVGE